jgi:predicted DNA-binding protein (MmcQ/YjbR family)
MNAAAIENYLSKLKGAESSYPFGPDALVYKIMGKMFALVSQTEEIPRITIKCDPSDGAMLVSQYKSVTPGYHMNKKHWITITLDGELPSNLLEDLCTSSYRLIVSKLTKKNQASLNNL